MNTLICVHKNGIINQYQIIGDANELDNNTLAQVVWNGQIHGTIVGLNKDPVRHSALQNTWLIKNYRAIYLNGIMIVKGGKVWPRKRWFNI